MTFCARAVFAAFPSLRFMSPPFLIPFSHQWSLLLALLLLLPEGLRLISIDNDIIGEPDIECLDQEIRIWVRTRKFFQGRIYTKGKADDPECAKDDFSSRRTKKVHFDLRLGRCGMKSLRSFDPRGMYYGVTLVISFHPLFITKVDQAFHVKCFFEEAQRGLTAELGVSMIPTTEVEARHGIPGCSYSIHRSSIDDLDAGKPAGSAIQFARVGDKVLHQWHCDDQMFGILINNCFVTDGVKQKHRVIDEKGCPVDPIAITGIRYSPDLQRAYAESQVFKFADRPGVWFFCQIQMCMKKEGMCDGTTPPACATTNGPPKRGRILSQKRKEEAEEDEAKGGREVEEIGGEGTTTEGNNSSIELQQDNGTRKRAQGQAEVEEGEQFSNSRGSTESPAGTEEQEEEEHAAEDEQQTTQKEGRRHVAEGNELLDSSSSRSGTDHTTTQIVAPFKQRQRENSSGSMSNYGGYGVPSPIGTETEEHGVTAFGPGYLANQVGDGPIGVGRDPPADDEIGLDASNSNKMQMAAAISSAEGLKRPQAAVSAEFETEDDLLRQTDKQLRPGGQKDGGPEKQRKQSKFKQTTTESGPKKDYADYDTDVTVPPNLTDLLANLQPEDISGRNLQKMFRDSVSDRRTLLQGFDLLIQKVKRAEEGEESTKKQKRRERMDEEGGREVRAEEEGEERIEQGQLAAEKQQRMARDSPIDGEPSPLNRIANPPLSKAPNNGEESHMAPSPSKSAQWHTFRQFDGPNDPPIIAGQLLIYDLDERPPATKEEKNASTDCAVTRHGLTIALIGSGALALILLLIAFVMLTIFPKQKAVESEEKGNGAEEEMPRGKKPPSAVGGHWHCPSESSKFAEDGQFRGSLFSDNGRNWGTTTDGEKAGAKYGGRRRQSGTKTTSTADANERA